MTAYDNAVGWVQIPHLLTTTEVATVLAACSDLAKLPSAECRSADKPAAGTQHLVELDERIDAVSEIVQRNELVTMVEAIIGPDFEQSQVSLRCPQPGFGDQKLHADAVPKLTGGPNLVATTIIPLVEFTAYNGATRVIPGSHLRPDLQRRAGSFDNHGREILLQGAAGSAFVFSGHLLHSGTQNRSTQNRPALQMVWRVRE